MVFDLLLTHNLAFDHELSRGPDRFINGYVPKSACSHFCDICYWALLLFSIPLLVLEVCIWSLMIRGDLFYIRISSAYIWERVFLIPVYLKLIKTWCSRICVLCKLQQITIGTRLVLKILTIVLALTLKRDLCCNFPSGTNIILTPIVMVYSWNLAAEFTFSAFI